MIRPFVSYALMLATALSLSGCGGSNTQVAQAPAAATPAAAPASAPSGAGEAEAMAQPSAEPESGTTEPESGEAGAMNGGGYGAPDMSGYNQESNAMSGGPPGMEGMGMGAMGTPSAAEMGAMSGGGYGGGPPMGYGNMGQPGMAGMAGMNAGEPESGAMGMGMGMNGMGMGMNGMGMNGQQLAAPVDPAPAEDATYLEKGRYAFAIGKEKEGIDYARAHAISGSEGASDILQQTKWYAAGLRPVTALRFAVGVVLEAPANATEFHPIGSRQLQGGGGGGPGMMGMPGGEGGMGRPGATKVKEHALYDLTGTFGEAFTAGFAERWRSSFGGVFGDVEKITPQPPMGALGGMGMGGGMAKGMGAPGMGAPGMEGMGMGMGMGMGGEMGGNPAEAREKIMPGSTVSPGLIYIGSAAKQADLLEKAAERGVDVVFLFDVVVSPPNRVNRIVQNDIKLRAVTAKGDPIVRSGELNNVKVERASLSTNAEDEVAKTSEKFFAQFDDKVKVGDLPPLKPEHAKSRLVQVLANSKMSKLEKLFEVSLYHSKGLITDDEKLTACLIVMEGSEGEAVANGRPEDKQLVLDPMLPAYK